MVDKKDDQSDSSMIDINYSHQESGSNIGAVLDKLYLCASVEFLLTVADFFLKSLSAASTERSAHVQLKQTTSGKLRPEKGQKLLRKHKSKL